jgi:glycine oxidase
MHDVVIIGGGVIGLSLAWELARHGQSIHVIDQGGPGRDASWAGAGILPAANIHSWQHPAEQLRGLASQLHPQWAQDLKSLTGIDTGYRRCGALHLARTAGEAAVLTAWADVLRDEGIGVERLTAAQLGEIEPGIPEFVSGARRDAHDSSTQYSVRGATKSRPNTVAAFFVAAEAQLRNPRHLRALLRACEDARVKISPNVETARFDVQDATLEALQTSIGPIHARQFCFTTGAWTGKLLLRLGVQTGILPIRGQMVLFRCEKPPITRIINEGSRYLVPRDDGRVLAGSTEEEAGFDKRTTDEAIADLTDFARGLVPALREAPIERTWAGLRPGSFDGLPYLGPLPGLKNAFVAAGHFRTGLFLSSATAVVMRQRMAGEQPQIDLSPFRVGR